MQNCTATTEIVLFVAAALGLGLAIVCLTVAAGWKARAEAWQRAYCDVVAAARPVADAARLHIIDGSRA